MTGNWLNRVHFGDCLETLRRMPDGIVNTCVTSPPYFGLRDYGHPGQIGLEATPDEFVQRLVEVFREVRRVLRDDGTAWINMGDSYGPGKQLLMIPARLALAMQADGWIVRQDVVWHKPNPMPESVTDRCTKAHEYIFLLSKSPRYYYDADAIKEESTGQIAGNVQPAKGAREYLAGEAEEHRTKVGLHAYAARQRSKRDSFKRDGSKRADPIPGQAAGTHRPDREESNWDTERRNRRSVWTVSTKPYSGAHFATFPEDLIEPCILAGAPAGGVVLDPFFGSGTTAAVATWLGRKWIGLELNEAYRPLIDGRLAGQTLGLELA